MCSPPNWKSSHSIRRQVFEHLEIWLDHPGLAHLTQLGTQILDAIEVLTRKSFSIQIPIHIKYYLLDNSQNTIFCAEIGDIIKDNGPKKARRRGG